MQKSVLFCNPLFLKFQIHYTAKIRRFKDDGKTDFSQFDRCKKVHIFVTAKGFHVSGFGL